MKEELIATIFEEMPDDKLALFLNIEIEAIEEAEGEILFEKIEEKAEEMTVVDIKTLLENNTWLGLIETRVDKKVS